MSYNYQLYICDCVHNVSLFARVIKYRWKKIVRGLDIDRVLKRSGKRRAMGHVMKVDRIEVKGKKIKKALLPH